MKSLALMLLAVTSTAALAKLPPLSDEAKAQAAEAAAKAAHGAKVENFLLCKSQDRAAAHYFKTAKAAGKEVKPGAALPPCADPGAYVPATAQAPAAPTVPATPAASSGPAAPAAAKKS